MNPLRCLHLPPQPNQLHLFLGLDQTERTFGIDVQVQRCAETERTCSNMGGDPQRCRLLGRLTIFLELFERRHRGGEKRKDRLGCSDASLLSGCRRSTKPSPSVLRDSDPSIVSRSTWIIRALSAGENFAASRFRRNGLEPLVQVTDLRGEENTGKKSRWNISSSERFIPHAHTAVIHCGWLGGILLMHHLGS